MALDFIHSVCSVGDSAQMEPLEYHLILSESPCDGESSSNEHRQGREGALDGMAAGHIFDCVLGHLLEMQRACRMLILTRSLRFSPSMSH